MASANAPQCPWKQFSELAARRPATRRRERPSRSSNPPSLTEDAAGPILVTVLGMVAEMERKFIRERQQAGESFARRAKPLPA